MRRNDPRPLRQWITATGGSPRHLWGPNRSAAFTDLIGGSCFGGRLGSFPGRSVLAVTRDQLTAALAMIDFADCSHIVRAIMADGGGRIVNVASIVGFTGYSGLSVYGATKASMLGFTRSLAREVGRMGVKVNAVAPGFLDSDLTRDLDEAQRARIVRRSALRRLPAIEDVAAAVEFLLGARSASITGTVLTVDAGSTA
jgi:3-oxoacyl-[acyl-carrier protein] reductase